MNISAIFTEARDLVDATVASYSDALLLQRVNTALETVVDTCLTADGRWQFDDANNTDYPDGFAILSNLVGSTKSYAIDTSLIEVDGVSVLGVNGIWRKLLPFDPDDLTNPLLDRAQFLNVAGNPYYYDLHGSYVSLYPAPDNGVSVTLTNGLKIYGKRTAKLFTSSDVTTGTAVPGFMSLYHHVLAYMAALPYAFKYKPDRVGAIQAEITRVLGAPEQGISGALTSRFAKRDQDERQIITSKPITFR